MVLIVSDHYEDARHHIEGDANDIKSQLLTLYPWLLVKFGPHADISVLVDALNKSQGCTAKLFDSIKKSETAADGHGLHVIRYDQSTGHGQINTTDSLIEAAREAGAFLAGYPCEDKEMRQALLQADGDPYQAALLAHNLPISSLPDLMAVLSVSLKKTEEEDKKVSFEEVTPTTESSKDFAEIVKKANDSGEIEHVKLGVGKHNKGILRARDLETHKNYILKPGSGVQNPVIKETDSEASQSQREAAFYALALAWGLGEYVPETHLLLLDGTEYACMVMLPLAFKNMNDLKAHDPNLPQRILFLYNNGTLHKWAAMDFVFGNPDRHAGNLMASGDTVKLIDHGSSFAGDGFTPATDGISFVPYYLRPGVFTWSKLTTDEKLRKLPRLNSKDEKDLRDWLLDLNIDVIKTILNTYGIEAEPTQKRLERLQHSLSYQSADLAILSAWVVP